MHEGPREIGIGKRFLLIIATFGLTVHLGLSLYKKTNPVPENYTSSVSIATPPPPICRDVIIGVTGEIGSGFFPLYAHNTRYDSRIPYYTGGVANGEGRKIHPSLLKQIKFNDQYRKKYPYPPILGEQFSGFNPGERVCIEGYVVGGCGIFFNSYPSSVGCDIFKNGFYSSFGLDTIFFVYGLDGSMRLVRIIENCFIPNFDNNLYGANMQNRPIVIKACGEPENVQGVPYLYVSR